MCPGLKVNRLDTRMAGSPIYMDIKDAKEDTDARGWPPKWCIVVQLMDRGHLAVSRADHGVSFGRDPTFGITKECQQAKSNQGGGEYGPPQPGDGEAASHQEAARHNR